MRRWARRVDTTSGGLMAGMAARWAGLVFFRWLGWTRRWPDEEKVRIMLGTALVLAPLWTVSYVLWLLTGRGPSGWSRRHWVVTPRGLPAGAFWARDPFNGRGRGARTRRAASGWHRWHGADARDVAA